MEKNRLEELRQGIFSQTLLIGGWKRRKAVTELAAAAKAQDRDAVLLLAEALKKSTDDQVKSIARDSLTSINEQKCINALCEAWHTDRSNELGQLLKKAGWVATTSDQLKLLTALKSGKLDHITNSGKEIVDQLFKATEDSDREIAENARTALGQLRNSTAHELLCKMVIEDDHKKAREIVLSAGYAPSDNHQKAVFYFLTQQWEKYDKLDSGQKLLRAAYEKADKKLKARLDEGAKANGRPIAKPEPQPPATVPSPAQPKPSQQKPTPPKPTPPAEPVKPKPVSQQPISSTVLAAAEKEPRKVYNLFDMTEKEWAMLIIALEENKQRAGIWHIAQEAPPKWSLHLLKWMKASGWVPRNEEKAEFDELTKLAQKCDFEALKAPIHAQATLEGHSDMVNCLAVTSDSRYLVSAGADKTAIVWDFAAGKLLHKLEGHSGA
ncbi:MAG: hypothetical protein JNN15_15605, partial [Blastocatellia bacterium]|nr:hypothetical protein [Blastocatellia bacterium]